MPVGVAKHGFWWVNNFSPIEVFPTSVPDAVALNPDNITFTATGGTAPTSPYTFSYTGTIPPGTSLDSAGNLTGSPTTPGTYNFRIIATDANGKTGYRDYSQEILVHDRAITKSNNILIVWDPNSVIPGIYGYDVNPADLASIISGIETNLGFIPTTVSSYNDLATYSDAQLANYAHIWDVGYDTLITAGAATQYQTYLASGGALFLLGENGYFVERDGSIDNFVTTMGGGTVTADPQTTGIITSTIVPEFLLQNSQPTVTFDNVGRFGSIGTGTVMTYDDNGVHTVVWKTGSLSVVPTAAIVINLDVNVFGAPPDGYDLQTNFINNLSIVLNQK